MSGRTDYEERKQMKKERYEELAENARQRSKEYFATHDKISSHIPLGQPILVGHHSEKGHRRDLKRMANAMDKSISESDKADYYDNKVATIESNSAISSDDPQAIQKLEQKLEQLEKQKIAIKARDHEWYELPYINKDIKQIKDRIQQLKKLDEIDFEDIAFNGGKVVHNKEINRIQILFDNIPDEKIRDLLKSYCFKWSRYEKAWQRLFNKNGIYAANRVIEQINEMEVGE